jgi:hypothetical protein
MGFGAQGADLKRLRSIDLTWREIEGAIVVLDLRSGGYLSVNGSGRRLWPLLVGGATADQLADALQQAYGIAAADAQRDVAAFLDMLSSRGLLE